MLAPIQPKAGGSATVRDYEVELRLLTPFKSN